MLGLFCGVSFLSIFEIIFWIWKAVVEILGKYQCYKTFQYSITVGKSKLDCLLQTMSKVVLIFAHFCA